MKQELTPVLADARLECVLMQAWKKTSTYLRYHSWYADTLGIDYQSLRISQFIREIQKAMENPDDWRAEPIEMVPAPKTQQWGFRDDKWCPDPKQNIAKQLRPLAHVSLRDQVVATALMMCLADRVETSLGDPRLPIGQVSNRQRLLAYGHRLYCDRIGDQLRHRWGSAKLYRQYFQDYQAWLARPRTVAESLAAESTALDVAIVRSDLSKFYDRVNPALLNQQLRKFVQSPEESAFFNLVSRVFDWRWSDQRRAKQYATLQGIRDFDLVALPQGLVASGFFANIAMQGFETALREAFDHPINGTNSPVLKDACYYVDDLRLVLHIPKDSDEREVKEQVVVWLQKMLDATAPGLLVERRKTEVTIEGRERRVLVPQSKTARRIQSEVSGIFDMLHGTELTGAIEGFFHTQRRYSSEVTPEQAGRTGLLLGISDMRDETAARFAAGKFRKTFRSLRPLLSGEKQSEGVGGGEQGNAGDDLEVIADYLVLSKQQLDERAKLFAALLIDEWIINPANVRLLRIALDMYPDTEFLDRVLKVLRPAWQANGARGPGREIRVYCLAELFRAGATETGIVCDIECLPNDASPNRYHERLIEEAKEVFDDFMKTAASSRRHPWYLMQQVFLYLGARNAFPNIADIGNKGGPMLSHYRQFAKFLNGASLSSLDDRSIFLTIACTGFGICSPDMLRGVKVSEEFFTYLNDVSPPMASHLWAIRSESDNAGLGQVAQRLGIDHKQSAEGVTTLADLSRKTENPFYMEENLLVLADYLLRRPYGDLPSVVTPWQVRCNSYGPGGLQFGNIDPNSIQITKSPQVAARLFTVPDWCETVEECQLAKVGLLLRFALRGSTDFHGRYSVLRSSQLRYNTPISHWEQQRYSGYQGRSAFGPAWLPISSFVESLLFQLLRWPGSGASTPQKTLAQHQDEVTARLKFLREQRGRHSSVQFLEQKASLPHRPPNEPWSRPLRVGIVQSVIPNFDDYLAHATDPELLNSPALRSRQRSHLAAIMEGVTQMIRVRDTHRMQDRADGTTIDLLVFPELAIHPDDIVPLVTPFVRTHKCILLFGKVYHREMSLSGTPLLNTCQWMIPEWTPAGGFHIRTVEQGKEYITPPELGLTPKPVGFRPAQWLVEYEWTSDTTKRPLILSASVCYDATDISLAADLRSRSDLYIVCALNIDVGTFDRMSEGLHYHMFQGVLIVNNGQFGGSSLFMPFKKNFHRQLFHLHGQPQASIAFAEIDPEKLINRPTELPDSLLVGDWKTPPAGWQGR